MIVDPGNYRISILTVLMNDIAALKLKMANKHSISIAFVKSSSVKKQSKTEHFNENL